MSKTKLLLKTGFDWLNENASDKVGLCNDRSCIRCRLADILFEIEKRFDTTSGNSDYAAALNKIFDELDDDYGQETAQAYRSCLIGKIQNLNASHNRKKE